MIGTPYEDPYEEIMKKYPKLFSNLSYVECADGWADLIDKVSRRIHLINNSYENKEDGVFAAQIKEKFGGLRYYVDINGLLDHDRAQVETFISEAEKMSYSICTGCGKTKDAKIKRCPNCSTR